MKVSLSVLGAAKTESGYNTRFKSFFSAMIGSCAKWTALMNRPENNFQLWGRRKFNLAEELFAKSLQSFETCVLVNINLYGKLFSSLESPTTLDKGFLF